MSHCSSARRIPLLAAFVAGVLTAPIFAAMAGQLYTWGEAYRTIPPAYQKMIDDSEAAFLRRDVAAAGASLTEDFSWYRVTEQGPELAVQGRGATMERLQAFFASPAWSDRNSEVHRLGMVGNTLVQVEIDTLNMGKGPVRQTSLHVYEFRDGKRWREFAFYPLPQ
jgi:ketosteroid isomerase-like protein